SPSAGFIAAITVGTLLGQAVEVFFHLAFFPPRRSLTNDEEIRRMQNAKLLSSRALIFKLDGRRLIVKLNHVRGVFQFLNAGQFILVALELNGDAHLAAGVTTAHGAAATLYETRRI